MLISEAFELYREREVIAAGLSSNTDESYIYAGHHAVDFFDDVDVKTIQISDITKFYEHLMSWQKPDTARGYMVCFRAVIKYLKRKKYIKLDPEDIKIPKREKRIVEYLTESEVEEFVEIASQKRRGLPEINRRRNLALVELIFSSGARIGEICKLNRNSIRDGQFVTVQKSKEPRPCYVSERAQEALDAYLELRTDKNPALFIANQTEKRLTAGNAQRIFRNLSQRCDLGRIHPHTLRHSFATCMLSHGVDLCYIGDMMGYQSLDTTKMYTHYENPRLKAIHKTVMG